MSFVSTSVFETFEEEQARLATAPVGSKSHHLSTLPETVKVWPYGLILRLPPMPADEGKHLVVVPVKYHREQTDHTTDGKIARPHGWWQCIVVASNVSSYPVGGYDLSVDHLELVRSTVVELTAVQLESSPAV